MKFPDCTRRCDMRPAESAQLFIKAGSLVARASLKVLQHPVVSECTGLLARGELLEGGRELPNILLRWDQHEKMHDTFALVIHALMVGRFEGVVSPNARECWDEGLIA